MLKQLNINDFNILDYVEGVDMKILIVTQRFWPENFRINDIAKTLVNLGHSVTVLTGLPNYPSGKIPKKYKHGNNRFEVYYGINIIRVKEIERKHNIISRFLNYWSFAFFGSRKIQKLDNDFDVVFANGLSPITSALPAIKYKKKYGTKLVMYEMDLWPLSLLAGGLWIKKTLFIYRHYKNLSKKIYSSFDTILVSTKKHIDYINELIGTNKDNTELIYLPQYAEGIFNTNINNISKACEYTFVFAGNIGKAQAVDTIIKAANILKNYNNIKFLIAGDGSEFKNVQKLSIELGCSNVTFLGQLPLDEMPDLFSKASAMLITTDGQPYCVYTLPGKTQSYMSMGKAIISSSNGAANELVSEAKCGLVSDSNDYKQLANNILIFIKNITMKSTYEKNAYEYYQKHFSKKQFMEILVKVLDNKGNKK